jgi:hypothetical protein
MTKYVLLIAAIVAALSLTASASGHNYSPKTCKAHPELCSPDVPVTPGTFSQANRILACADQPVSRVGETPGIAVNMTAELFASGVYAGVKFTVARLYVGYGATCETHLGGAPNGKTLDGYPIWVR